MKHPENDPVTIPQSAAETRRLFLVGTDCEVIESSGLALGSPGVYFFPEQGLNATLDRQCFENREAAERAALQLARQILGFMDERRKRILTNIALFNKP